MLPLYDGELKSLIHLVEERTVMNTEHISQYLNEKNKYIYYDKGIPVIQFKYCFTKSHGFRWNPNSRRRRSIYSRLIRYVVSADWRIHLTPEYSKDIPKPFFSFVFRFVKKQLTSADSANKKFQSEREFRNSEERERERLI